MAGRMIMRIPCAACDIIASCTGSLGVPMFNTGLAHINIPPTFTDLSE